MKNISQNFSVYMCPFGGRTTFIIQHFPSDKYIINQIIFCVFNCLLIIPTLLLNVASVLTILKCSQLRAKICYFQVLIQSSIDIGVGAISLPLYTFVRANELLGSANCASTFASETIAYIMFALSVTSLSILTIERYMSVLYPFTHRLHLTKRAILVLNFCGAVPIIISPTLVIASNKIVGIVSAAFVTIIVVFNTFAYTRIFLAVRGNKVGDSSAEKISPSNLEGKRKLREQKLAKSCALVVAVTYLCYIPSIVCYQYFKDDPVNFRVSHSWSMTVYALNSSLNSILFFWRRPLLREEAYKVVRNILM